MTYKLSAIIEKDEHGCYAYCPELKGCHTQGDSIEEAIDNLQQAAELHLETMSPEEIKAVISHTILATSLDVEAAGETVQ